MKNHFLFYSIILFSLLNVSYAKHNHHNLQKFQFDGKSTIIVQENLSTRKHFLWGQYVTLLPPKTVNTDSSFFNGNKIAKLDYNIRRPSPVDLLIDDEVKLHLFLVPNDTLFISVNFSNTDKFSQSLKFKGKYSAINKYLFQRDEKFGNKFQVELGRLLYSDLNLTVLEDSVNKISNSQINYLMKQGSKFGLPIWYMNYTKAAITYKSAQFKIGVISYRKDILKTKEKIPSNYFRFIKNIKINNHDALIIPAYYYFLSYYFYNKYMPEKIKQMNSHDKPLKAALRYIEIADSLLTGEVKEIFKCYEISELGIKNGSIHLADALIKAQRADNMSPKYLDYLVEYRKSKFTLKKGKKAPTFYLMDTKTVYHTLSNYKGKVVLLNFWFPGCHFCMREIPYEHKLIKKFKGWNFCLINICFFSKRNTWLKAIKKLDMEGINLLANNKWQDKLTNEYNIGGYPHYTLIDKNGNIYSNNPKRPSEGVEKDIEILLKR